MTGDRSLFLTLTMKEGGTVGFGGNQTGKIIGSGTIGYFSASYPVQELIQVQVFTS